MLVLLHGSNASGHEMEPLARLLRPHCELRAPNLLGHGGRPVPNGYSLEEMSEDLIAWLDAERIGRCDLFGYSVGGYVALHAARRRPDRFRALATLAAKFVFDHSAVSHVVHLSQPARLARPEIGRKAEMERAHGSGNWEKVALNTCELFRRLGERPPLGEDDLGHINVPALIISGDRDPLVPEAESRRLAELLPFARLALFPGPAHPLAKVPLDQVGRALRSFIADVQLGVFLPGPPIDLSRSLVSGGLPGAPARVSIGKKRL
jgi:pimeloyl-ACP methyl ester carboxylesterase